MKPYRDALSCMETECHQCSKCVLDDSLLMDDEDDYHRHWFPFLAEHQGTYLTEDACMVGEGCVKDSADPSFAVPTQCEDLADYDDNLNDCIFQTQLDPALDEPLQICAACDDKWATAFGNRFYSKKECKEAMCHDCQKCEFAFASEFETAYTTAYDCQLEECHDCSDCPGHYNELTHFMAAYGSRSAC